MTRAYLAARRESQAGMCSVDTTGRPQDGQSLQRIIGEVPRSYELIYDAHIQYSSCVYQVISTIEKVFLVAFQRTRSQTDT